MKRALLILQPHERAIFSARAASEGVQGGRLYPSGSSLLGWAARRYNEFTQRHSAYEVFHSGVVRFSDALPLTQEGKVGYPTPKTLVHQKGSSFTSRTSNQNLDPSLVWVGRHSFADDTANHDSKGLLKLQPEALSAPLLTLDLRTIQPGIGARLRTATEGGVALQGSLFGYTHLEPNSRGDNEPGGSNIARSQPFQYAATVEADSVSDESWSLLRACFERSEPLRLGRGAATGYGGWYECSWVEIEDASALDPWRPAVRSDSSHSSNSVIYVWALSDLALVNDFGMPDLMPGAKSFGLDGDLIWSESAVALRRYSPWNGHLRTRDVERVVIEAGSVLAYRTRGADLRRHFAAVGLWQESGLGRVWIDCPMLRGTHPTAIDAMPISLRSEEAPGQSEKPEKEEVVAWAIGMSKMFDPQKRDKLRTTWILSLNKVLAAGDGPSPSQWFRAATAARRARKGSELLETLFDGENAACGATGSSTRGSDWGKETRQDGPRVRDWLQRLIADEVRNETPAATIAWALDQLAKEAARRQRAARERDG